LSLDERESFRIGFHVMLHYGITPHSISLVVIKVSISKCTSSASIPGMLPNLSIKGSSVFFLLVTAPKHARNEEDSCPPPTIVGCSMFTDWWEFVKELNGVIHISESGDASELNIRVPFPIGNIVAASKYFRIREILRLEFPIDEAFFRSRPPMWLVLLWRLSNDFRQFHIVELAHLTN